MPVLGDLPRHADAERRAAAARWSSTCRTSIGNDDHRHTPGAFGDHEVRLEPGSLAAPRGRRRAGRGQVPPPPGRRASSAKGLSSAAGPLDDDVVEAIELPDHGFALGVLWHPEEDDRSRVIARAGRGARASRRWRRVIEVIEPATEQVMAEVPRAGVEEIDAAVARPRAPRSPPGARSPPATAPPCCTRSPTRSTATPTSWRRSRRATPASRSPTRAARSAMVVDTLPLLRGRPRAPARRHDPGRRRRRHDLPRAARRRRPDRALELPARDRLLEGRAGAGGRQHGRAEARRADAADRARARADRARGRAARGRRSTSSPARERLRAAAGRAPRRRQDRLHRLDRGRRAGSPRARRRRSSG